MQACKRATNTFGPGDDEQSSLGGHAIDGFLLRWEVTLKQEVIEDSWVAFFVCCIWACFFDGFDLQFIGLIGSVSDSFVIAYIASEY